MELWEIFGGLNRVLAFLKDESPSAADVRAAQRAHRRIAAMLQHPLLPYVGLSENVISTLTTARDALRANLGYTADLEAELAQMTIEEEIWVRLQPDHSYKFMLRPGVDVAALEAGTYTT